MWRSVEEACRGWVMISYCLLMSWAVIVCFTLKCNILRIDRKSSYCRKVELLLELTCEVFLGGGLIIFLTGKQMISCHEIILEHKRMFCSLLEPKWWSMQPKVTYLTEKYRLLNIQIRYFSCSSAQQMLLSPALIIYLANGWSPPDHMALPPFSKRHTHIF